MLQSLLRQQCLPMDITRNGHLQLVAPGKGKTRGHAEPSSFYRGSQLDVRSLAESLPQLPGTRTEVETIAKSLDVGKDDIKLGLDATEQAVKQSKLDDYRVVYFAAHGLVAGDVQGLAKANIGFGRPFNAGGPGKVDS
jgi:CHAT domain-containing protein